MIATLRADGSPRISPMEPRIFEGELVLVGMPGTTKFHDLDRDPRFCLHTATVDTEVADGDAKLWGQAEVRAVLRGGRDQCVVGRGRRRTSGHHDLEAGRARARRAQALTTITTSDFEPPVGTLAQARPVVDDSSGPNPDPLRRRRRSSCAHAPSPQSLPASRR
jgi:hypothetical protein